MSDANFIPMTQLAASVAPALAAAGIAAPTYGALKTAAYSGKFPTRMVGRERVVNRDDLPSVIAALTRRQKAA